MKYFGHDCNAGDDYRLVKVILKYTIAGYGVYFRCNELIATKITDSKDDCILEQDCEILAHICNLNKELIKEILEYFVELGLFDKTTDGRYRNLKLLSRADEYYKRQKSKIYTFNKVSRDNVGTMSGQHPDSVGLKEKKRNEKKRKENKPLYSGQGLKPETTKAKPTVGEEKPNLDSDGLSKEDSEFLRRI